MTTAATEYRYGPYGFLAALVTIAIVETATWMWLPFWIANLGVFGIATVVVVPTGFFMSQTGGSPKVAQIGRGILIGYLATPLTMALAVIPPVVVTQLLHLA